MNRSSTALAVIALLFFAGLLVFITPAPVPPAPTPTPFIPSPTLTEPTHPPTLPPLTATITPSSTVTIAIPTAIPSVTSHVTISPQPTVTSTQTATSTASPTATRTATPSPIVTSTVTQKPTSTPSTIPTQTPTVAPPQNGVVGFGSHVTGGRNCGTTIQANTPAQVLTALQMQGCRTINITAVGELRLSARLNVTGDNLSIIGNPNFAIVGNGLTVWANNVIIDGLVILHGADVADPGNGDTLFLRGNDMLVTHSTLAWSTDETLAIYGKRITVQHSVIQEGLNRTGHPENLHSMGAFAAYFAGDISLYANVLIHNGDRNPQVTLGRFVLANNIIYNTQRMATLFQARDAHIYACALYNEYIHGLDSGGVNDAPNRISIRVQSITAQAPYNVYLWLADNRNRVRTTAARPETDIVYREEYREAYQTTPLPEWCNGYPRLSRAEVLSQAGAGDVQSKRVLGHVPASGYVGSAGRIIDSPSDLD